MPLSPFPWKIEHRSDYVDDLPPEEDKVTAIVAANGKTILFTDSGYFEPNPDDALAIFNLQNMRVYIWTKYLYPDDRDECPGEKIYTVICANSEDEARAKFLNRNPHNGYLIKGAPTSVLNPLDDAPAMHFWSSEF